jgi:hypothetical protein
VVVPEGFLGIDTREDYAQFVTRQQARVRA